MGTFDNATQIICTNCGTPWLKSDANTGHYFQSTTTYAIGSEASPSLISVAAENMTYCPGCTTGQLADASYALEGGKFMEDKRTNPDGLDNE